MHQRNLGRKHAVTANEALGPVDRVDQPKVFGVLLLFAAFLAKKTMVRKFSQQDSADNLLGPAVGMLLLPDVLVATDASLARPFWVAGGLMFVALVWAARLTRMKAADGIGAGLSPRV